MQMLAPSIFLSLHCIQHTTWASHTYLTLTVFCFSCVYSVLLKTHQNSAGYAGHFVMAQLLPSNLKDYDVLLAAQLGNISVADATTAQTIATNAATLLLQNRSALLLIPCVIRIIIVATVANIWM